MDYNRNVFHRIPIYDEEPPSPEKPPALETVTLETVNGGLIDVKDCSHNYPFKTRDELNRILLHKLGVNVVKNKEDRSFVSTVRTRYTVYQVVQSEDTKETPCIDGVLGFIPAKIIGKFAFQQEVMFSDGSTGTFVLKRGNGKEETAGWLCPKEDANAFCLFYDIKVSSLHGHDLLTNGKKTTQVVAEIYALMTRDGYRTSKGAVQHALFPTEHAQTNHCLDMELSALGTELEAEASELRQRNSCLTNQLVEFVQKLMDDLQFQLLFLEAEHGTFDLIAEIKELVKKFEQSPHEFVCHKNIKNLLPLQELASHAITPLDFTKEFEEENDTKEASLASNGSVAGHKAAKIVVENAPSCKKCTHLAATVEELLNTKREVDVMRSRYGSRDASDEATLEEVKKLLFEDSNSAQSDNFFFESARNKKLLQTLREIVFGSVAQTHTQMTPASTEEKRVAETYYMYIYHSSTSNNNNN